MVFNGHPYSLDLAGTPQTLKAFTPTSLQRLHSSNLKKSEMVLTYCGEQDFSVVYALMKEMVKNLDPRLTTKKAKANLRHLLASASTWTSLASKLKS